MSKLLMSWSQNKYTLDNWKFEMQMMYCMISKLLKLTWNLSRLLVHPQLVLSSARVGSESFLSHSKQVEWVLVAAGAGMPLPLAQRPSVLEPLDFGLGWWVDGADNLSVVSFSGVDESLWGVNLRLVCKKMDISSILGPVSKLVKVQHSRSTSRMTWALPGSPNPLSAEQ